LSRAVSEARGVSVGAEPYHPNVQHLSRAVSEARGVSVGAEPYG
jgi:hypothetical protein